MRQLLLRFTMKLPGIAQVDQLPIGQLRIPMRQLENMPMGLILFYTLIPIG